MSALEIYNLDSKYLLIFSPQSIMILILKLLNPFTVIFNNTTPPSIDQLNILFSR